MRRVIEGEVKAITSHFEAQRTIDHEKIAQTEHQMEQMSETLRYE